MWRKETALIISTWNSSGACLDRVTVRKGGFVTKQTVQSTNVGTRPVRAISIETS
jgi:hypothetical protein